MAAIALLVLFWAGPGVKAMLEQSRQAKERDWAGLLVPLLLVVAFVLLLMKLV
jgi:flagellar biogenesis protein FliO